jgi:hypothetical protein
MSLPTDEYTFLSRRTGAPLSLLPGPYRDLESRLRRPRLPQGPRPGRLRRLRRAVALGSGQRWRGGAAAFRSGVQAGRDRGRGR